MGAGWAGCGIPIAVNVVIMDRLNHFARRTRRPFPLIGLAVAALVVSCSPGESKAGLGPNEPSPITQLVVTPASVTLHADEVATFSVSAIHQDGSASVPSVTWSATGGLISTGGVYTPGPSAGDYTVTASLVGGSLTRTAAVTIIAVTSPIVSLAVAPGTADLFIGEARQFTVTATRQDGSTLTPTVAWTATGGAVTTSGNFTAGATPGNFRVMATLQGSGLADTSSISISVPVAGSCSHRPAGYNNILPEFDFSAAVPAGGGTERSIAGTAWSVIYDGDGAGGSNFSKVSDPTAPHSPSDVWRLRQAAGDYGTLGGGQGHGFGNVFRDLPANTTALYACWFMKLSNPYYLHPVSHKYVNIFTSTGNGILVQLLRSNNYFEALDVSADHPFTPQINLPPALGVWHLQEIQIATGNPGIIRVWIDGQLRTEYTTLPVEPGARLDSFGLFGHLGGGGFDLAADQYQYFDHILIAIP